MDDKTKRKAKSALAALAFMGVSLSVWYGAKQYSTSDTGLKGNIVNVASGAYGGVNSEIADWAKNIHDERVTGLEKIVDEKEEQLKRERMKLEEEAQARKQAEQANAQKDQVIGTLQSQLQDAYSQKAQVSTELQRARGEVGSLKGKINQYETRLEQKDYQTSQEKRQFENQITQLASQLTAAKTNESRLASVNSALDTKITELETTQVRETTTVKRTYVLPRTSQPSAQQPVHASSGKSVYEINHDIVVIGYGDYPSLRIAKLKGQSSIYLSPEQVAEMGRLSGIDNFRSLQPGAAAVVPSDLRAGLPHTNQFVEGPYSISEARSIASASRRSVSDLFVGNEGCQNFLYKRR